MADKISTIVLKVDLECERCYRKIRKVLCKIQDKMNIKTISFDEKSNAVTISGPFDADTVCNKLCCKDAGKPAAAEKKKEEKADKKEGGKGDKEAKPAEKGNKDGKAEAKKVKFAEVPAADAKPGKPAAPGPGGYYGVPVYDSQGWYYGGGGGARQPYYPQQHCCEDPNAGCSVM
uniref:HMA domain-containing protein n=1 Tax=Zea mays TaxID=4577 RepID=A0A804UEU1_MAIZE